jgi:hypothetical protein
MWLPNHYFDIKACALTVMLFLIGVTIHIWATALNIQRPHKCFRWLVLSGSKG